MNPQHFELNVAGVRIDFHICIDDPLALDRIRELEPYFYKLPRQHLVAIYPIFVINLKPGGDPSGGTWKPEQVHGDFTRPEQIANTHVPLAKIKAHAISQNRGVIGIPRNRWERPIESTRDIPGRHITVMHEVAHSIDFSLGLSPRGATEAVYDGIVVGRECNARPELARRAAVAYRRFIMRIPLCDVPLPGELQAAGNARLIRVLRSSPAFASVPLTWNPLPR
jgi:hypothetical protein